MTATQDLFALSYTTRTEPGDVWTFDGSNAYTAEQVLAKVVALVVHPDNAHVDSVEVRRVRRVENAVAPQLAPVSLVNSNAYAGWSFESYSLGSDVPFCQVMNGHEHAAETLVKLLGSPKTVSFTLYW